MNERILQLAKQSGLKFPSEEALSPVEIKFAELIVRECACLSYLDDSGNPEVEEALEFWRKNMLKHFGVKE